LKDILLKAVDNDFVLEIEDETLGFLNESPKTINAHLRSRGGTLDFANTMKLIEERDSEWDGTEVPQILQPCNQSNGTTPKSRNQL
jgi:hypothetical protein